MTEYTFTSADVGCYLDGHFGWHNTYRVIELAQGVGFTLSEADAGFVTAYREQYETYTPDATTDPYDYAGIAEAVYEIADEATYYLGTITDPALSWVWEADKLSLVSESAGE